MGGEWEKVEFTLLFSKSSQSSGRARGPYTAKGSALPNHTMDPASSAGTEGVCGSWEKFVKLLIVIPAKAGIWLHVHNMPRVPDQVWGDMDFWASS